jgi:hypothetical protein
VKMNSFEGAGVAEGVSGALFAFRRLRPGHFWEESRRCGGRAKR